MNLTGAILIVLLGPPAATQDASETAFARVCRLADGAAGIAEASERATCSGAWAGPSCRAIWPGPASGLAGELSAIAVQETGLRGDVQRGVCGPHECDGILLPSGRVHHRARSWWQLHRSRLFVWESIVGEGPEPVAAVALGAARVLSGFRTACGGTTEGAHAGYAAGMSCRWSGARSRANLGAYYAAKIARLAPPD